MPKKKIGTGTTQHVLKKKNKQIHSNEPERSSLILPLRYERKHLHFFSSPLANINNLLTEAEDLITNNTFHNHFN